MSDEKTDDVKIMSDAEYEAQMRGYSEEAEQINDAQESREEEKKEETKITHDSSLTSKYADRYTNKSDTLNRTRLLLIILGGFVGLIIFLTYILPLFQKKDITTEDLDKLNRKYIPTEISKFTIPQASEKPEKDAEEGEDEEKEDLDSIMASIPGSDESKSDESKYVEPTVVSPTPKQTTTGGGGGQTRPETNRNPIQKQVTRMKWDASDTHSETAGQSNNNPYAQFGLPSKEDYIASMLPQMNQSGGGLNSTYSMQNNQSDKQAFFSANSENAGQFQWNSDYSLFKGSIIQAVLETGINSDLPGVVVARVTKNVFSSLDGKYMLIPAGSRLFATYNSSISIAQKRVQIAWNTLIRPDGFEYDLGNFSGVDLQGYTGVNGFVNEHFFEYVKAMGIISAFSIANGELDNSLNQLQTNSYTDQLVQENRNVVNKLSGKLIERALDIQPTITVKPGTVINIITNKTLDFPPLDPYETTNLYRR